MRRSAGTGGDTLLLAERLSSFFPCVGGALGAYVFAIQAAAHWGEPVKSAFDLYLPSLSAALDFDLPSNELKEQQEFCLTWTSQFRHRKFASVKQFAKASKKPTVRGRSTMTGKAAISLFKK
jgi:hypothetical protein